MLITPEEIEEALKYGKIQNFDFRNGEQPNPVRQNIVVETGQSEYQFVWKADGSYTVLKNKRIIKDVSENQKLSMTLFKIAKARYYTDLINSQKQHKDLLVLKFADTSIVSYALKNNDIEVVKRPNGDYKTYVDGGILECVSSKRSEELFSMMQSLYEAPIIRDCEKVSEEGSFLRIDEYADPVFPEEPSEKKTKRGCSCPEYYLDYFEYVLKDEKGNILRATNTKHSKGYRLEYHKKLTGGRTKEFVVSGEQAKKIFAKIQERRIRDVKERVSAHMQECQLVYHDFGKEGRELMMKIGSPELALAINDERGFCLMDKNGNESMRISLNETGLYVMSFDKGKENAAIPQAEIKTIYEECKAEMTKRMHHAYERGTGRFKG